jgi:hypothetical protein
VDFSYLPEADRKLMDTVRSNAQSIFGKAEADHNDLALRAAIEFVEFAPGNKVYEVARSVLAEGRSTAALHLFQAAIKVHWRLLEPDVEAYMQRMAIFWVEAHREFDSNFDIKSAMPDDLSRNLREWALKQPGASVLSDGNAIPKKAGRPQGFPVDGMKLRKFRGKYTQEDLASKCEDVSVGTIKRGEAGGRWDEATFQKVAETLSKIRERTVTPDELKKSKK